MTYLHLLALSRQPLTNPLPRLSDEWLDTYDLLDLEAYDIDTPDYIPTEGEYLAWLEAA